MRTIQTPVYTFEEVEANKELLTKVLEKNRYYIENDSSYIVEDFETQCDGACFVGTYWAKKDCLETIKRDYPTQTVLHDCVERLEELRLLCEDSLRIEITHSGRYVHENSMDFDVIVNEEFEEHIDFIENEAKEIFKDLAKELYKNLEEDYYYDISDEGLTEYFRNSDLEFLEDGSIYYE